MSKCGDKASTSKDRALDKQASSFMQKICQKYDNVAEVDKLAAVARKVDTVKIVMQENVDAALQNCVKLESIEKAAGKSKTDSYGHGLCANYIFYANYDVLCRGIAAAGGRIQAQRQRAQEQDVVEEHEGALRCCLSYCTVILLLLLLLLTDHQPY